MIDDSLGDPLRRETIVRRDDNVLANVRQFAGEIPRVRRLECGVGQSLAGTVRRAEVFQHGQAFAEVRLDRRFDDLAARLGHQTAHTGQLANLFDTTASTRVSHQVNRVHVRAVFADVVFQFVHHRLGDLLTSVSPVIEHLVVSLLIGDHAAVVQLLSLEHERFGLADNLRLVRRRLQIAGSEGETGSRRFAEADFLHAVQQPDRLAATELQIAVRNHALQILAAHRHVVEGRLLVEDVVEHHAARSRQNQTARLVRFRPFADDSLIARQPQFDLCVSRDLALRERQMQFGD